MKELIFKVKMELMKDKSAKLQYEIIFEPALNVKNPTKEDQYLSHIAVELAKAFKKL